MRPMIVSLPTLLPLPVLRGLDARERGIIHRDLKPANIKIPMTWQLAKCPESGTIELHARSFTPGSGGGQPAIGPRVPVSSGGACLPRGAMVVRSSSSPRTVIS